MFNDTKNKILGVIGGMGPLATNLFYEMVIEKTQAHKDQDHVNMIILNHATMPDRTEAILTNNLEPLFSELLNDGKMLEAQGVCAIAIPCNTSHLLIDRLQQKLSIPVINMIRETVDKIGSNGLQKNSKIGILATDGTISTKLYQRECERKNLTSVVPSKESQRLVMKIIYDGIKNGGEIDYRDFENIEEELKAEGCQNIILGCTELSVFKKLYKLPELYVDAMSVLAEKAILTCGKGVKNESGFK